MPHIPSVFTIPVCHHGTVEKPELILESKPEHHFLRARCSLCRGVCFNLVGNTLAEKSFLWQMFDIHVRQVHEKIGQNESRLV
jgi:hypothetical protein